MSYSNSSSLSQNGQQENTTELPLGDNAETRVLRDSGKSPPSIQALTHDENAGQATPRIRTMPLNVLLIGAGYRIQNCFLPVLGTLDDRFKVVGIYSRTPARRDPLAKRWAVPAVSRLEGSEMQSVDVVGISVPNAQNANVLRALLPQASTLRLVVDTPGAANLRELAELAPLLARFKSVAFTEDHMNLPNYALLRQAVAQGLIGEPKTLTLFHTGYLYHGLAALRAFANFQPVVRSWRRKVGTLTTLMVYKFRGGFEGCVVNPYHTNQPDGGMILEGTAGVITEFPTDLDSAKPSRPVYLLKPRYSNGVPSGFVIDAGAKSLQLDLPALAEMRKMSFEDKSEYNLRRTAGMANVFRSIVEPGRDPETRLNADYGWKNALYDSFASRFAERGYLPFDPLALAGSDMMQLLLPVSRLLSRARSILV